ncbi:MAG TPA: hypothetical protein VN794_00510 [Methylomirabilota bacterium]|nr:hypothetical protein [Methylomirabilota bacterium]
MRKSGFWLLVLAASIAPAFAQVTAEVRLDQDQFLVGESLPTTVRITNRSGQPLNLGAEEDWLTFAVESRDGFVVAKNAEAPVAGEFRLESSKAALKHVDLAPYFSLNVPGRYTVTANIKIKNWDRQVISSPTAFNVIQGAKFWEQEFGVPASRTNGAPEVRHYVLQQANFARGRLRLYLRLTDETGAKTLRVQPIGPLVSFSRVEPQIDKLSNLHVLYADGPRSYSYSILSPDGDVIGRQSFEFVESRPRLAVSEEGNISVTGGVRRLTANDLPAPTSPIADDAKPKR